MSDDAPHLRVALPWARDALRDAHDSRSLPPLRSLAWMAGRGVVTRFDGSWRRWLVAAVDPALSTALDVQPAGPTLAALSGAKEGTAGTWGAAQPVHLAAGLDHVRLAAVVDAVPTPDEVEALSTTIRGHFAGAAFELCDFVEGAWVVRCEGALDVSTRDPLDVIGRNIHDYMPAGTDGARVRSWMNELQMLLHEHPVNVQRERQRRLPINGLWLWGFGTHGSHFGEPQGQVAGWRLRADDLWLRAFWRRCGGVELPLAIPDPDARHDTLIAMTHPPTTDAGEALAEVDSSLLAKLQQAVQRKYWDRAEVLLGDRVVTLDRHARWRFWRSPIDVSLLARES